MLVSDLAVGNRIHELAALVALIRTKVVPQTRIAAYADRHGSAVTLAQLSENDRLMSMDESVHEVIGAVTDEVIDQAMATVTLDVETLGRKFGGWAAPLPREILLDRRTVNDPVVVSHEAIHDLLGGGDHDDPRFAECEIRPIPLAPR